ncbi:MAG: DUF4157 domain-containing protein [Burkholderiaceae bacterium]|nr:DUF4157 domain-containing protein [Burkholderiaceae bacterium]
MAHALTPVQRREAASEPQAGRHRSAPAAAGAGVPRYLGAVQRACSVCDATPQNTAAPAPPPRPDPARRAADVHATAAAGVAQAERPLPGAARIQQAFGRHDVSGVRAQVGGPAAAASQALGARAFTTGPRIGFRAEPDLRLAAHEAAHVVQQRQGVQLKGGVGQAGDPYEQHADAVADRVAAGQSAEDLLDTPPVGGDRRAPALQSKCACGGTCADCAREAAGDKPAAERSESVGPESAGSSPAVVQQAVQFDLVADAERQIEPPAADAAAAEPAAAGGAGAGGAAEAAAVAPGAGPGAGAAAEAAEPAAEAAAGATAGAVAEGVASRGARGAPHAAGSGAAETGEAAGTTEGGGTGAAAGAAREAPSGAAAAGGVAPAAGETPGASVEGEPAAPAGGAGAEAAAAPGATSAGAEGAGGAGEAGGAGGAPEAAAEAGESAATPAAAAGGCGSLASPCYTEDYEEPDPAPENEPADPEAGTSSETHEVESPDIEGADDCPVGAAVTDAASAAEAGATAEAETAAEAPAGEAGTAVAEGAGAAATAGAAAGGGGGGPDGEAGGDAGAAMAGAIARTRGQRDDSVAAYAGSRQRLRDAAAGTVAIAAPLSGAGLEPGARQIAARADQLFGNVRSGVDEVAAGALGGLADRLGSSAQAIKAGIGAAIEAEQAAVSARVARARARARAQAATAHGRIDSEHASAVATIQAAAEAALAVLDSASETALSRVDGSETDGLDAITALYADSHDQHIGLGRSVGAEAVERGGAYVDAYEGCKIHEMDSWTAGYLTDRRAEAQQNAARETAGGYQRSLEQAAADQAAHLNEGRRNDRCGLRASATQARDAIAQQHEAMSQALSNGLQAALAQAAATRDAMHQSVDGALADTLAALSRQARAQRQAAADTGYLQQLAVEQAAHGAAATLMGALSDAIGSVGGLLAQARNAMTTLSDADPDAAGARLAELDGALQGGLARLATQAEAGAAHAEQRLTDSGSGAMAAMGQLSDSHADQTRQHSEGFGQAMQQIGQSAAQALGEMASQQAAQSQGLAEDGAASFDDVATGLEEAAETMLGNIADTLAQSESALETSLRQSMAGLDRDIPAHACEAASHEQPAWKSVVKWVLIIAIVVVVALVIGPAVIGAVGAAAGALGASAAAASVIGTVIGGAIVGAATSGVIQVVNNWAAGQDLTAGLGRAMVMGAIGGALGGAAGQLIGRAAQAYQLSGAMQFTLNLASDMVLEIGTELVTGEFSWEALGMALLMTVATGGFGEIPRVRRIQARVQHGAAARVPGRGAAHFAESIRPPEVTAPGHGPAARPAGGEAEAGAPRAGETAAAGPRPAEAAPGPRPGEAAAGPRPAEGGPTPGRPAGPEAGAPRPGEPTAPHQHGDVDAAAGRAQTRPAAEADPATPARELSDADLLETTANRTQIGDEPHAVAMRRNGDDVDCEICSLGCGRIRDRMQAMEDALPNTPEHLPMRQELADLRQRVAEVEAAIEAGSMTHRQAIDASAEIAARMRGIGEAYPSVGKAIDRPLTVAETYDTTTGARPGHEPVRTDNLSGASTRPRQDVSVHDAASLKLRNGMDAIYVLRDVDTGAILKVGKTVGGRRAARRFETYRRAADDLGLNLRLEVTPVAKTRGVKVEATESALRARLEGEGHVMPWDNSPEHGPIRPAGGAMPGPGAPTLRQGRLGRAGPGTPGDARRAALRASHEWVNGWLVPRLPK